MFYCIACNQLHQLDDLRKEADGRHITFRTGFHYINDTLYQAGYCSEVGSVKPPLVASNNHIGQPELSF
ncbi:DUF3973 domain-containing protein [Paenibacillus allorhizosphaerae]|uniref:DUF3973 domain-containing protein n=1 Tax=Paenibacillus allorhizosphaerae TaxID=2849866 RepID=A0ABM8VC58_9BACL|nr:hypothetical protein PAECIP111802_00907 [Paenibacillus allorhizosphaerae]